MGLFSRTPEQKMERALDRLDKAAHYYENWIHRFPAMHSEREMNRALDRVVDLFSDAMAIAIKYDIQREPADVLSHSMERWIAQRAEETGRKNLLPVEAS